MTSQETWPLPVEDPIASGGPNWLEDRVAVVAGGGLSGPLGNIGFGIAWLYARSGATVAVLDADRTAGERTVDAIRGKGGTAPNRRGDARPWHRNPWVLHLREGRYAPDPPLSLAGTPAWPEDRVFASVTGGRVPHAGNRGS